MSETSTPVCDLIAQLMSTGMSPGDAIAAARIAEPAIATGRAIVASQRDRWRLKKQRQRARMRGDSPPGPNPTPIISSSRKEQKKDSKKDSVSPNVPLDDGWPADHLEIFWNAYPPYRREAKRKVGQKLERLRRDKVVSWATLMNAVMKYAASNPGQYASAPMAWLNGEKWDREYGKQQAGGASNGQAANSKLSFAGIAARIRQGARQDDDLFRSTPEGGGPADRS